MEHTEVLAVNRVDRPSQVVNLNLFFSFLFFLIIGLWGALRFFGHDASEDEYLIKNSILVFAAFLLLPFSLWTLVYRKDWFGVVALAPSIFIMPAFFVSAINQNYDPYTGISGLIFVPLVICGVAISVIFFFRRFENKIFWTIAGLAISVLVVLDLVVLFFWLTRSILLLLTISLPVYLLYKAFRDNAEVLSLLSPGKLLSATLKTLALWSPLSIFIIAGLLMGNFINDLALKINENAFNSAEQVTESALAFEDCSWYDLVCKKTESIKQQVRQSIETSKQRFNAKELVVQILSHLALLSNVIFIFLAVKSFFYVFARVGVSKKYGLHATLAKQYRVSSQSLASNINLVGQEYTIPPLNTEIFYVVRTLEASGCPPMIKVPQWSCAILSRILTQCYTMNEISGDENDSGAQLSATGSSEFIEWNLKEGEQVIFQYPSLAAIAGPIKLSTIVSFRLPSLVFGRVFHSCATGPGKLIFLSKGKSKQLDTSSSVPIKRIIAWDRNAHFEIKAQLNPVDIFFSGIYFKPLTSHAVLIDADEKGKPDNGLIRFVKNFLIPF